MTACQTPADKHDMINGILYEAEAISSQLLDFEKGKYSMNFILYYITHAKTYVGTRKH
jgi:hypothetical protein